MTDPTTISADGFVVAGKPAEEEDELRLILSLDPAERNLALTKHLERAKREATESSRSQVRALLER